MADAEEAELARLRAAKERAAARRRGDGDGARAVGRRRSVDARVDACRRHEVSRLHLHLEPAQLQTFSLVLVPLGRAWRERGIRVLEFEFSDKWGQSLGPTLQFTPITSAPQDLNALLPGTLQTHTHINTNINCFCVSK